MTSESTTLTLSELLRRGLLVRFEPQLRQGDSVRRGLYMPPALAQWVNERPSKTSEMRARATVRAKLGVFALGAPIDDEVYMKALRGPPVDIWELRPPGVRIFGAFYGPDRFVCTNRRARAGLDFEAAMKRADSEWYRLFLNRRRYRAASFDEYVTDGGIHLGWDDQD